MGIGLNPQFVANFQRYVAPSNGVATGELSQAAPAATNQSNFQFFPLENTQLLSYTIDIDGQRMVYENGVQQVYLNGENITSQLREEAVGNMASVSSAVPAVRAKLLDLQRNLAKEKDVVMDGRDIGTNVLPNADVKVYLTASVECRAMRRFKELEGKGEACDFEQIRQDIQERDERDMTREIAPLKQAEDATLIDSSEMGIDDVVKAIIALTK